MSELNNGLQRAELVIIYRPLGLTYVSWPSLVLRSRGAHTAATRTPFKFVAPELRASDLFSSVDGFTLHLKAPHFRPESRHVLLAGRAPANVHIPGARDVYAG